MEISPAILVNPGIYEQDQKRREAQRRFNDAVKRADFLTEEDKRKWKVLGYYLDTAQLQKAKQLLLNEKLHRLKIQQKLEALKPKEK